MMAARCGPRRANFDAMLKARGQSPARIAACTCASLVCKAASCGGRLYTERARISRRDAQGRLHPRALRRRPRWQAGRFLLGAFFFARVFAQARPRGAVPALVRPVGGCPRRIPLAPANLPKQVVSATLAGKGRCNK